jgi:TolA-binding protein
MDLYYSANGLYNRKLYQLAVDQYKQFLTAHPKHAKGPDAQFGLALSHYALNQFAEAETLLARLASNPHAPNRTVVHTIWGQCLLQLNRAADAESAYLECLKSAQANDQREPCLAGLVETLFLQQKWQELSKRADELIALAPQGAFANRTRYQCALARYELRDFKSAAAVLQPLATTLKDEPYAQHAILLLAECRRELGEWEPAIALFDQAARKMKGAHTPDALYRLGFVRFEQKKLDDAMRDFGELRGNFKDHPLSGPAGVLLGRCYLDKNNVQDAINTFRGLASVPSVGAEAVLWLGRAHLRQNQFAEASQAVGPALARHPKDPLLPDLLFVQANALLGEGKYIDAAQTFARVFTEFPASPMTPDALRLGAFSLQRAGKHDESGRQCALFLKKYPQDPAAADVSLLLAENQFLAGQSDDALQSYRAFLASNGSHARTVVARLRTGQILYQKLRWADALKELEPLTKEKTNDPVFAGVSFLAGSCCFQLLQWDGAVSHLQTFLRDHPKHENADAALLTLALAQENKGDKQHASKTLEQLVAGHPQSALQPKAHAELGRLRYEFKQYGPAREVLAQLVQRYPQDPAAAAGFYYLGWVSLAETKTAAAAQQFTRVADSFPKHELAADARLQQAFALLRLNDAKSTQGALETFLKDWPQHGKVDQALFHLGFSLSQQQQCEPAIGHYRKLAQTFPKSAWRERALYEWARCDKLAGRQAEASQRYAQVMTEYPQGDMADPVAFELAEMEFQSNQADKAMDRLNALLARTKDAGLRERALYRLGWCQFEKGDSAGAAKSFESMLRDAPQSEFVSTASYQAGEARLRLKEYEPARQHFERALASKPTPAIAEQALLRLGESQGLTGRWGDSERSYHQFLQQHGKSEWTRRAWLGLGWARENQKKFSEAIDAYNRVVADKTKDETGARSQFQIGECYFAMNQYDEAIKHLINVEVNYGFASWSAKALLEIGRALERKGATAESVAQYKEVIQKYPNSDAAAVAKDLLKGK